VESVPHEYFDLASLVRRAAVCDMISRQERQVTRSS